VTLDYGEPQVAIALVFLVIALAIAAVALVVAVDTTREVPLENVQDTGYRFRRLWLGFLVALGVVLVGASFFLLPYASGGDPATTVKVSGGQFFWTLDPAVVQAHTMVRFDVTSVDVNHGFGVYDPQGRMLGSVQAMPGYTNELDLTFDTRGQYRIRCLEYCGLSHHAMQAAFQVVER
jgi:cytochrome c oxidase subunit 2